MKYSNSVLFAKGQQSSTDNYNDFGYFNDGTVWYETPPTYTARVTAYAAATGITDYTILDSLNEFDKGLVYWGLDTIMKALYPMVTDKTSQSDMANQMKYNFMNPLDTNPAFRLQWFGGWVYSRTGALPNGVNAYADTFLAANTMAQNSTHFSFYSRTNRVGSGNVIMGYQTGTQVSLIYPRFTDNNAYVNVNRDASIGGLATAVTNTTGLYVANRTSSTNTILYKNNVISSTNSSTSIAPPAISYYLGTARNLSLYDNLEFAFASIGDGLTDFQAGIFSTLVNNLQKALNRAVY